MNPFGERAVGSSQASPSWAMPALSGKLLPVTMNFTGVFTTALVGDRLVIRAVASVLLVAEPPPPHDARKLAAKIEASVCHFFSGAVLARTPLPHSCRRVKSC